MQGTVGYMSPEQAAGNYSDMRADQFALGAMLYEMVSGHRAFLRETDVQTLADIIEADPRPLDTVCRSATPALIAIVNRCLQKDPRDRYGSTVDLAHDLKVAAAAAISDTRIPTASGAEGRAGATMAVGRGADGRDAGRGADGMAVGRAAIARRAGIGAAAPIDTSRSCRS